MATINLQSYKVVSQELSSSTKFNNLVQAIQDAYSGVAASLDISVTGSIAAVSSVTAGQFITASNGLNAINLTATTGTPGMTIGSDTNLYRSAAKTLSSGQLLGANTGYSGAGTMGGLFTSSRLGVPVDADFQAVAAGLMVIDETNNRFYVRRSDGVWKYAALT